MALKAGCDPGFENFGFNWLHELKEETLMVKVNLKFWDGKVHHLGIADIGPCVYEFCLKWKHLFEETSEFVVEHLPEAIGKKPTNVLVRDVMTAVTQTIHILYPHIKIYYASPMTMKAFTRTSGAKSHAESKKRTSLCNILPADKMNIALKKFQGRRGKLQVDPIDATIASMLLRDHRDRLLTSKFHKPGVVREFHTTKMASEVVYPEKIKRRKKSGK